MTRPRHSFRLLLQCSIFLFSSQYTMLSECLLSFECGLAFKCIASTLSCQGSDAHFTHELGQGQGQWQCVLRLTVLAVGIGLFRVVVQLLYPVFPSEYGYLVLNINDVDMSQDRVQSNLAIHKNQYLHFCYLLTHNKTCSLFLSLSLSTSSSLRWCKQSIALSMTSCCRFSTKLETLNISVKWGAA